MLVDLHIFYENIIVLDQCSRYCAVYKFGNVEIHCSLTAYLH